LKAVHFVEGDAENPEQECQRLGEIITQHPIDAALTGTGENGRMEFAGVK
jgi:glucosamine-6-phosphate deaminase